MTAGERAILRRIANMDASAIELLLGKPSATLEASGLDARTHALVRLAALIAINGSPASFVWEVNDAQRCGVTEKELSGLLVAVAPMVGSPRVASAAAEIAFALTDADVTAEHAARGRGRVSNG